MSAIMSRFVGKAGLALACLLMARASLSAPYAPASDDTVVATVKAGRGGHALPLRWRQDSGPARDLAVLAYARQAIEQARHEGDPRWLGAAQAALAPWWSQAAPPAPVRLLRATILQSLHDFGAALKDLDALVDAPIASHSMTSAIPGATAVQARFTRASILQVQGRWAEAAEDCQALAPHAPIESAACRAELRGLAGDAVAARDTLRRLVQDDGNPARQAWLNLMLAELAERMGQPGQAEMHYLRSLRITPDSYTLGAYADLLLDAGRPADVARLLQGHEQVDALLLRLAMAWQRMGPSQAGSLQQAMATLQANFDAARLRGERVHMREEARFELVLKRRPQAALLLAQANWSVQKEPADARVLMDAARAASSWPAQQALQAWVHRQGLVDARLALVDKPASSASTSASRPRQAS